MERLVTLTAPRNWADFLFKGAIFLFLVGSLNYLRDLNGPVDHADGFMKNLKDGAFVGTPFVVLFLLMLGHMKRLQGQLADLAATDMLTGLPNRRAFFDAAEQEGGTHDRAVVMMVDVDHFKRVNDTYGHAVGDLCLQQLAKRLRQLVRQNDVVARLGGEEFAILLQGASQSDAEHIAGRITEGAEVTWDAADAPIRVTTSVGVARRERGVPFDKIIDRADAALYQAKTEGRACFRHAAPEVYGAADLPLSA